LKRKKSTKFLPFFFAFGSNLFLFVVLMEFRVWCLVVGVIGVWKCWFWWWFRLWRFMNGFVILWWRWLLKNEGDWYWMVLWFCKKKFEKCFVYAAGGKIGSSVWWFFYLLLIPPLSLISSFLILIWQIMNQERKSKAIMDIEWQFPIWFLLWCVFDCVELCMTVLWADLALDWIDFEPKWRKRKKQ
jgi:hypothetical protein